jgi:hypothetical protein
LPFIVARTELLRVRIYLLVAPTLRGGVFRMALTGRCWAQMNYGGQLRAVVSDAVLDFANHPPHRGDDHGRGSHEGEGIPGGDQNDDAGEKPEYGGYIVGSGVSVGCGVLHLCLTQVRVTA